MNIYGKYQDTLDEILNELLTRFNNLNTSYQKETDQRLFEHLIGRVKSEKSMEEKCKRKG